jgi:hypothetical protein
MSDTTWDDVGKRFADLGRRLEETWTACRDDDGARDDLKDASEKVKAALDDVAETIDRAISSDEVREATRSATTGVAEALASTLHQVATWIEGATASKRTSSSTDEGQSSATS